jgi:hypothetical protein
MQEIPSSEPSCATTTYFISGFSTDASIFQISNEPAAVPTSM